LTARPVIVIVNHLPAPALLSPVLGAALRGGCCRTCLGLDVLRVPFFRFSPPALVAGCLVVRVLSLLHYPFLCPPSPCRLVIAVDALLGVANIGLLLLHKADEVLIPCLRHSSTNHSQSFRSFLKQGPGQRFCRTVTNILYRLTAHKGQLPTCHMITSKVVDYIDVLNPLPLLVVLAQ
jgi:hypothetical protein